MLFYIKIYGNNQMSLPPIKVDFENAELLVSEYGKELRREQIIDETKFEDIEITDNEEDLEEISKCLLEER